MTRILVFGLAEHFGGTETVFDTFYDNINKSKYHFDFVAREGRVAFQDKYIKNGSKVFNVPNFTRRPFKYYSAVKNIMREGRYDVVYINMLSAANVLPAIAAKNVGIGKIVLHAHNNDTTGLIRKALHCLGKPFLRKDCFTKLACSDGAGKYIYGKSEYTVINNPFNYNKFKYNSAFRSEIREKHNISNECKLLGMIGRFSYQKNPLFIIDVFKKVSEKLDDVKMMFVGDGELKAAIVKKAEREGVLDRMIIISNTEEVYKYYSALDLFIMPSVYEGLGMVGLEAQASGLGCLFSEAVPKEIDMGGCKYLELNADIWARNAVKMLNSSRDREASRQDLFGNKFGITRNTKMLLNAFDGSRI